MDGEPSGPTIALLGHYGNANLGDEAIIQAARESILQRIPNAKVIGISGTPVDTVRRHGMYTFPVRRGCDTRSGPSVSAPDAIGEAHTGNFT